MNLEDLTKTQLLLLSLLITFVSSIGTTIITTSLLASAPLSITQTINRVVERTVEKVVPGAVQTKEIQVIVKEDDLVVEAVSKNKNSLATLVLGSISTSTPLSDRVSLGSGFFVSDDGLFVTDRALLIPEAENYSLVLSDESVVPVSLLVNTGRSLAFFKPKEDKKEIKPKVFQKVSLAKRSDTKLGQKVVALAVGGERITSGTISQFKISEIAETENSPKQEKITFRISGISSGEDSGFPIVNLDGSVVGIYLKDRADILIAETIEEIISGLKNTSSSAEADGKASSPSNQSASVGGAAAAGGNNSGR